MINADESKTDVKLYLTSDL